MTQLEMFTEAPPVSATPSVDLVRARLREILATLAAADKMTWSELRRLNVVVPQMANWLPTEERKAICSAFGFEVARLRERAA